MGRDTLALIVVGGVVVLVVLALGIGAFVGTTTSSSSGAVVSQPMNLPEDGSTGVVFDLNVREGMSIFGVKMQADKHAAHIGVVVPPECVGRDASGREELSTEGVCADIPVQGELAGGGTTPDGGNLAIVRVEISRECYEALSAGGEWPSADPACRPQ
jgi:hypothetical protein